MPEIILKHADEWQGEYREIAFSIRHWGHSEFTPDGIWNYYLYVPIERLPEDARDVWLQYPRTFSRMPRKNRQPVLYRPYGDLPDLELHSGCTFYRVIEDDMNAPVGRVGCDYNHAWDQGCCYNEQQLLCAAKHSIDALWEVYPGMLHRCRYCYSYHPASEGHETKRGWISFECEEKIKQEREKAQAKKDGPDA